MIYYTDIVYPEPIIYRNKKRLYDDNIYTFDIETISLFKIKNKWQPFRYDKPPRWYRDNDIKKACVPYIWQFGINDTVYYGREFYDFADVLKELSDPTITKYIYIHNLSYETQFLIDIIQDNKWKVTEMCARNVRQPIQFKIKDLNIVFRCSYMLTNLSLEKSAEKYTNVKKATGDLDYNTLHSPFSQLNENELYYCEMDIKTLYEIIRYFRDDEQNGYKHVQNIPLTQTGEVRRALKSELDYWYFRRQWDLVPPEHIYCYLISAFQGGITHANALYSNRVLHDVWSYDEASAYPFALVAFKYPSEQFFPIRESQIEQLKDTHALMFHVKLTNVKSKLYNHYLSKSKCYKFEKGTNGAIDNGRIVACASCELICTDVDMEMIKLSYDAEIEYKAIYASYKKYLDKRVIMFILNAYKNKTELKNKAETDETTKAFYMKEKQKNNCMFGLSATNPLKSGIEFDADTNTWTAHDLGDIVTDKDGNEMRFIDKKLNEMKRSYSTLLPYSTGVWCTAYARRALWSNIAKLDGQVAYYDTDSIKGIGDIGDVIDEYNKTVLERLETSARENNIDISYFMPCDDKGNKRPLGVFECETTKGNYTEFKTLGAKKYCYRDNKGLHLTVSGVRKSAISQITDIEQFKKGLVFDYEHAQKLTHYYMDAQQPFTYTDKDGNRYHSKQRHSIVLQPTTYSLGITDEYETYIEMLMGILPDGY